MNFSKYSDFQVVGSVQTDDIKFLDVVSPTLHKIACMRVQMHSLKKKKLKDLQFLKDLCPILDPPECTLCCTNMCMCMFELDNRSVCT